MARYNGLPTQKKLDVLSVNSKSRERIAQLKKEYTNEIIEQECIPDEEKMHLLSVLDARGYRLACCSNATTDSVRQMLRLSRLEDFFDVVLGNTDVEYPKPNPEIYWKAAELLNVPRDQCVIYEDSDVGIEAARRSYMAYFRVTYDQVTIELVRGIIDPESLKPKRRRG